MTFPWFPQTEYTEMTKSARMTTTDWLDGLTALIRGLMIIVRWAEEMKGKLEKGQCEGELT